MSKSKKSRKGQLGLGDELLGPRPGETRDSAPKKPGTADLFIVDNSFHGASEEERRIARLILDQCLK